MERHWGIIPGTCCLWGLTMTEKQKSMSASLRNTGNHKLKVQW